MVYCCSGVSYSSVMTWYIAVAGCHIRVSRHGILLYRGVIFECHDMVYCCSGVSYSSVMTWYIAVAGCHIRVSRHGILL